MGPVTRREKGRSRSADGSQVYKDARGMRSMGSDSGVWGRATPTDGRTDEAPGEADGVMERGRGAGASAEKLNQSLQARVPPRYGQASTSVNSWVPRGPQATPSCPLVHRYPGPGRGGAAADCPARRAGGHGPSIAEANITRGESLADERASRGAPDGRDALGDFRGGMAWRQIQRNRPNCPRRVCSGASPAVQAP